MDYGTLVRRYAARNSRSPAVIYPGGVSDYGLLNERTERLAGAFSTMGIPPGSRVALLGENGLLPLELMVACCKASLIYVPIDFRLNAIEVLSIIEDCEPAVVVVTENHLEKVRQIRGRASPRIRWISATTAVINDFAPIEKLIEESCTATRTEASAEDPFCIIYTSGTTGRSKGVLIDHRSTLYNSRAVAAAYGIDSHTRYLISLPYSATGTVNHGVGPVLTVGGTVVFDEVRNFTAERYFATVEQHRVTHNQLVPTMLFRLLDAPERSKFDLSSLQTVGYGSASIPPHRVAQLVEAFGPVFVQAYGMTETCSLATILTREEHQTVGTRKEHILGSCGRAIPEIKVRIINEQGEDVRPGEIGEIALRGPWFTKGYWNNPAQTADLIRDGWLYTGDLGRMDEEEFVYLVDRKKDVIITGGSKVTSTEVESVIYSHPAILEAAAIGVPDDRWGERVHVVVVCRAGQTVTPESLISFCRERLASYKCPKSVEVRLEMPKTSTGKLSKASLKAEYRDRVS